MFLANFMRLAAVSRRIVHLQFACKLVCTHSQHGRTDTFKGKTHLTNVSTDQRGDNVKQV